MTEAVGQGVGFVREERPVAAIAQEMAKQARDVLQGFRSG